MLTVTDSPIVWRNVFLMLFFHTGGLYGLYLWVTGALKYSTITLGFVFGYMGSFGVTAGAHRLWSHRCYKAKPQLRLLLVIFQTFACQNSVWEWCRDHRMHHKYSETDADPHNSKRGFFFSHIGWLLVRKHDDIRKKGHTLDMSDIESDPFVMFQKRHFGKLTLLACFAIPTVVCWAIGEDFMKSWYFTLCRYVLTLNFTWLVNSAAHIWGYKPYDRSICPSENKLVALLASGEGWHNYHHVFPWDYKTAELGNYSLNFTTAFIDFFAWLGWAYDLRSVSKQHIEQRAKRTGDGSHSSSIADDHDFSRLVT